VWHYQMVHHPIWDYDPPGAPNLRNLNAAGGARDPREARLQRRRQLVGRRVRSRHRFPLRAELGRVFHGRHAEADCRKGVYRLCPGANRRCRPRALREGACKMERPPAVGILFCAEGDDASGRACKPDSEGVRDVELPPDMETLSHITFTPGPRP
jgi:hypothetical protein